MKQTNPAAKKIDIFWAVFSVVSLLMSIQLWLTGKDYFFLLMFAALGIVFSIKELISKVLYNILRGIFSLGMLYYVVRLMME